MSSPAFFLAADFERLCVDSGFFNFINLYCSCVDCGFFNFINNLPSPSDDFLGTASNGLDFFDGLDRRFNYRFFDLFDSWPFSNLPGF